MKYFIFCIALLAMSCKAIAQNIPFAFESEDDNRLIKENDNDKYYVASGDTTNVVYLNDETNTYRLFNADKKLLVDGGYSTEGEKLLHEGKWTEYYADGKVKSTGYYKKDNPMGTWEFYYPNGNLKMVCNYAIILSQQQVYSYCLSGSYREYYDNGKLKVNGFFSADMDTKVKDTITVVDPVTGSNTVRVVESYKPHNVKYGLWEYYSKDGELEKKEDN